MPTTNSLRYEITFEVTQQLINTEKLCWCLRYNNLKFNYNF